jgi:hypothetical protein
MFHRSHCDVSLPQVEIDEYRDYEKALSALREALKYMVKARAQDKEARCKQLQQKIYLVDRFVEARKVVKSDPNEMVKISHQLLEQPDVEQVCVTTVAAAVCGDLLLHLMLRLTHLCGVLLLLLFEQAVRIGDVFALLVEYYHAEGNMQQSYVLIEKMQERKIIINPYLDTELVRPGSRMHQLRFPDSRVRLRCRWMRCTERWARNTAVVVAMTPALARSWTKKLRRTCNFYFLK